MPPFCTGAFFLAFAGAFTDFLTAASLLSPVYLPKTAAFCLKLFSLCLSLSQSLSLLLSFPALLFYRSFFRSFHSAFPLPSQLFSLLPLLPFAAVLAAFAGSALIAFAILAAALDVEVVSLLPYLFPPKIIQPSISDTAL
mgnify:CR=1 FL=1